jgi:hypothetical protein
MAFFSIFGEKRAAPVRTFKVNDLDGDTYILNGGAKSFAGERVNEESAMGVPAIASAISALSNTIASLPIMVFKKTDEGRVKADKDPLYRIVHDVVNSDGLTSFQWRKWMVSRLETAGRSYSFIEKNKAGRVMNIWPLDDRAMVVTVSQGRKVYTYTDTDGKEFVYAASEILDFIREPTADASKHRNPLHIHRNIIGEMIAAQRAASALFESGGVPAHILMIPEGSPESQQRNIQGVRKAMRDQKANKDPLLPLTSANDIKVLGIDPQKQQMLEIRNFQLGEVARIWGIPPSFIQDHSRSTFSNVESLNLHYSQHTIMPRVAMIEAEMNSKLTSDRNRDTYIEFAMDGLERGDKKSQYEGFRVGINSGFLKPNEVRSWMNLPEEEGGDELYVQGAMVKIVDAGKSPEPDTSEPVVEPQEDSEDKDVAE